MGKLFEIGSGGMVEISVKTDDTKNQLQPGRILELNGYNCPRYVIVKNQGIDSKYAHYGARYLCVNLEDFTFKIEQAYTMRHISDRKDGRIQLYITDETLDTIQTADAFRKAEINQTEETDRNTKAETLRNESVQKGRELFAKYIPADAKALIVAELESDDCDMQTDYFNTTHSGLVVLGWSTHKRDIFSEMRKHAHKIPETEHLATAPIVGSNGDEKTDDNKDFWHPSDEHREKYSMGAGYYLKRTGRYSTGWKIEKQRKYREDWGEDIYISLAKRCIFEEQSEAPEIFEAEVIQTETTTPPEPVQEATESSQDDREPVEIGKYKNCPTIKLPMNGRGFTFGKRKAALILEYIDEIRAFVGEDV